MLYFAYGSNLYSKRMSSRLTGITRVGPRMLPGFELRFHKVGWRDNSAKCDAFRAEGTLTPLYGILYDIPDHQVALLDDIEGVGQGYDRETVQLFHSNVQPAEAALTYIATLIDPTLKPYDWYRHHVIAGAREGGFPAAYIERILCVEVMEDIDLQRAEKEWSIHR
ncbi:gamma-glutamylcyclotransferase family protein [Hahella ganghwensis]|uniref:gamma-glutamylcyclotransferase family protein n=1 Tax=Hahella ganghwensis TaxID=286420 RepID=UPI00036CB719|nr:gamma-glutamylcyclotransferase family protein [Hahella ganghwensis]